MRDFLPLTLYTETMNVKPLKYALMTAIALCFMYPAHAADLECRASPEQEIITLRMPEFGGSSNIWDITYAEEGMDVFSDIIALDTTTVVAAGAYTKDKDDGTYHPLIVKFDDTLKPVWELREDSKEHRTIHRILKTKSGFTVLGDIINDKKAQGVYIASYTDDGKVKGKPTGFYEAGGNLDAKAFIPAQDGGGYIAVVQYTDAKDTEKQYGILYKISGAGKIVWKRTYQTGRSNVLNNVQAVQDGTYVAVGQVVLDEKKSAGWLLRLDHDGALKWQKTYPRGMAASLQAAMQTTQGDIIVSGKSRPFDYDGSHLSAWVMKTDSAGTPKWQRYLRGDFSYSAPDMIVYEDGRASVLLSAAGSDTDHRSHARIITFTPQGTVDQLDDYTDGQNASAQRLISGANAERILTGYAQTSFGENQEGNTAAEAPSYTYDGWILAAPALETYEDPCLLPRDMSPLLP